MRYGANGIWASGCLLPCCWVSGVRMGGVWTAVAASTTSSASAADQAEQQHEPIFSGQARGKPLSNMAMEMVLRRMKVEDATVHGFRSSFRDYAGNVSSYPREITETALAHVIGDKAEQAYRRRDALEKRRKLMEAWLHIVSQR